MKGKRKNRGFGLIELIVALAILGISGGAIATFMVTSQRSYASGTAETDLQYEAQLVANQLQDLIIDTAKGISYEYSGTLATGSAGSGLLLDDTEIAADTVVSTKTLYVYDEEHYYLIKWDNTVHELYYSDYLSTEVPAEGDGRAELLAEYVTGFSVDLRDVSENRTVKYTITFTKESSGKEYSTTHKIKLRNDVLVNEDMSNIYEEPAETPEVTSVDITPTDLYLWPGESTSTTTADDTLSVTPTWKDNKSGSYYAPSWSYVGKTSSATAVDASGELTLGADETGSTINDEAHRIDVIASVSGQADTAKVGVRWIDEISLTAQQLTSGTATYADISLNGQTVQEGSVGYRIRLSNFTGSHLKDTPDGTDLWTGSDTDATRTSELKAMGGVTISVEDGDELITLTTTTAAGAVTGDLTFYVNSGIDWTKYSDTNPATVTIRFTSNRTQYANGAAYHPYGEITFTVTQQTESPIIQSEWLRGGLLQIDFSALNKLFSTFTKENGETITIGNIGIYIYEYSLVDGELVKIKGGLYNDAKMIISNNGGWGDNTQVDAPGKLYNKMYVHSQGEGSDITDFYYDNKDLASATKGYLRLSAQSVPYSQAYSDGQRYCGLAAIGIRFFNNDAQTDESQMTEEYIVNIAPVAFSYSANGTTWTQSGTDYTVYMVGNGSDSSGSQTVRVYYKLTEGWDESDTRTSDEYTVKTDRFVFTVTDSDGEESVTFTRDVTYSYDTYPKTYYLSWNTSVTSGKDSTGYYLDLKVDNSILQALNGETITVSYEQNPCIGTNYSNLYYDAMIPCKGSIKINVVNSNIDLTYWEERVEKTFHSEPSVLYCPSPTDLSTLGLAYDGAVYQIGEDERFLIRKSSSGDFEILYQRKKPTYGNKDEWKAGWTNGRNDQEGCYMSWQSETGKWKYTKKQSSTIK